MQVNDGKSPRRATAADWMKAHGLTREDCAKILELAHQELSQLPDPTIKVTSQPEEIWSLCAEAAAANLPSAVLEIGTVRTEVGANFSPDTDRFPRAFTVHRSTTGLPFVSCPWRGELKDVLAIAHEFGHALQLVLSAGRPMPPVNRELCACFLEYWCADHFAALGTKWAKELPVLLQTRTHRSVTKAGPRLIRILADQAEPYSYNWNYPIARSLALLSKNELSEDQFLKIFKSNLKNIENFKSFCKYYYKL